MSPKRSADVQWQAIYDRDADGDGYTNGEELGDPNGNWMLGDPSVAGPVSHPAKANDIPCGNGEIEGPEDCDGFNLNGETCQSLGEPSGTLTCDSSCTFDTSGCTGGGGTIDAGMDDVGTVEDTGPKLDTSPGEDTSPMKRDTRPSVDTRPRRDTRTSRDVVEDTNDDTSTRRDTTDSDDRDDVGDDGREDTSDVGDDDRNDSSDVGAPPIGSDTSSEGEESGSDPSSMGTGGSGSRMDEGGCTMAGEGAPSPLKHGLVVILTLLGAGLTMVYRRVSGRREDEETDRT